MKQVLLAFSVLTMAAMGDAAWGHGSGHSKNAEKKPARAVEETEFGRAGDPKKVTRTIGIEGSDDMRYTPNDIRVKQGETIRFVVKNGGKLMHELVLGTMAELLKHYEWMKKFPDMEHDEPHMAHLKPGASGEIVWQFTKAGDFHFACLIPGHLEAGMSGKITVLAEK
jgi:uncharacterized cupredoxin-like copper-binding protein